MYPLPVQGNTSDKHALSGARIHREAHSDGGVMLGLMAAFIAIGLGSLGPRFRWRGAILLGSATVGIGSAATFLAWHDAQAAGLQFGVTAGSVFAGLLLQLFFMTAFYSLATAAAYAFKALVQVRPVPPVEQ